MLEDTLLTHPHVRVQAADQMNSFIYCEKLEFLKCHIHTTVKCDRKPNRASNRISYADRKVWNFLNEAENIVILCLLKLHRIVISLSSRGSFPVVQVHSLRTQDLLYRPNAQLLPPSRYSVERQVSMEGGGGVAGGEGKRVNQAGALSFARHHVAYLQLNKTVLRGILTPSSLV